MAMMVRVGIEDESAPWSPMYGLLILRYNGDGETREVAKL